MKLLKTIEIENIKTNSKAKLDGLNDFNIIIGPNNCGKTSILKTILSVQDVSSEPSLTCTKCQDIANSVAAKGIQLKYDISDLYLGGMDTQRQPYYKLSFYHEVAKKLFEECYAKFSEINMDDEQKPDTHLSGDLIFTGDIHKFRLEHLSPFIFKGGFAKLQSSIFYCPESRLQTYKDMPMQAYIRDKRLRGNVLSKWVNFISSIVDSKVEDFTGDLDLSRKLEYSYETSLEDQGSGVRSVACLAIDILTSANAFLLLIDEPELGLNPYSKQLLLQFLLDESKKRQIIITTHDPTFVNPILWQSPNVSVYLYSLYTKEYVKIDLAQSDNDPETFGGYLPHTSSLRDIHIYVEGTSDVYIFQSFLRKYCRAIYENWSEMINRVGIFHLGGDFWCHLLHTLPGKPYKCIIILDGDKKQQAQKVCQLYSEWNLNMTGIKFASTFNEIKSIINDDHFHPVYCLENDCIERYLGSKNDLKPPNYNKKIDGPNLAEKTPVPREIHDIFWSILD